MVKLLETELPEQPGRILDVGASTGVLLKAFQDAFACEITGVEPGDAYRAYAENRGIPMYPSLEALTGSKEGKFSVVSLIHVLEHLPDPVGMLRSIRRTCWMKRAICFWKYRIFYAHDSYELAHLACYTPHTLQEVLRQAGFERKLSRNTARPVLRC